MQQRAEGLDESCIPKNELYNSFYIFLEGAIAEVLSRVEEIRKKKLDQEGRDPVEYCKTRIKSCKSMEEKLKRKGLQATAYAALNEVYDAAGIRIICTFIDDVYQIAGMLRNQDGFQIIMEKDYIAKPKPNGYRSYHMIVRLPVRAAAREEEMYAEIQIRTIAMECWASLEHQLKYKHCIRNTDMIVAELKRCADEIASTDLTLLTIRDLIHEDEIEA